MSRTRFAPSPTGHLHLGHAFSALTAWEVAGRDAARFVLRIEDIDRPRCRAEFETAIFDDLAWLGLDWERPVLRQSSRLAAYDAALARLSAAGLTYPCRCTRADIAAALGAPQEGAAAPAPYPGTCRHRTGPAGPQDAVRLNMAAAIAALGGAAAVARLGFEETGPDRAGWHALSAERLVATHGDVVLARRDIRTSYALAVVVDDAEQRIETVTRGQDLFDQTEVQVLLQALLGLPTPRYHHHRLIRDETGRRLAKRDDARSLRTLRAGGATPEDIRRMVGLGR